MKDGHIASIEFLDQTAGDASRITQAVGVPQGADGFEVWEGKRFIYRFPEAKPRKT